jgi:hypothetical protein
MSSLATLEPLLMLNFPVEIQLNIIELLDYGRSNSMANLRLSVLSLDFGTRS